ncbi:hypothetical protein R1sor_024294 [Riccia sorocarpa]|uniref:CP-type G domain-containing protein n=1 Tax=Riccia sorocarpa TaxID=122646 RepID=A0ABD3GQW3_9MARC
MGWRKKTKPPSGPGLTLMNKRKADGEKFKLKGNGEKTVLESVMEIRDLDAVMEQAELAGRIFSANNPLPELLISAEAEEASSSATPAGRRESKEAEEEMYRANLTVPRRPEWNSGMTAEELDAIERKSFLTWRRGLVRLEENDKLVLTPFEKNIDVWRQLWRVLERSDLVVVVVDSRNPLFYRCPDLENYVREIDPSKKVLLLLNKADLLTTSTRQKWANYFKSQGIPYLFWSAKAASAELEGKGEPTDVKLFTQDEEIEENEDTHVFEREELLERLQKEAEAIVESRKEAARVALSQHLTREDAVHNSEDSESTEGKKTAQSGTKSGQSGGRVVVGFVGYPNVGKSSTINALVGEKKTGVTSTPGKTKHFQTLIINEKLMLCDCPGLVFPSFSSSKAEMVACGVLSIDKLTDHRGPVQVVANVVPRAVLEKIYGIRFPDPKLYEAPNRPPTAAELLYVFAVSRGYFANGGLPDETRTARLILKDFLGGKLPYSILPPGENLPSTESSSLTQQEEADDEESGDDSEGEYFEEDEAEDSDEESDLELASASDSLRGISVDEGVVSRRALSSEASSKAGDREGKMLGVVDTAGGNLDKVFNDLDSSLLSEMRQASKEKKKAVKAPHKMHKKTARKKDRTWRAGSNQEKIEAPVLRGVKIPVSHGAADLYQVPASSNQKHPQPQ